MTDQLNREGVKAIAHALQDRSEAAAAATCPNCSDDCLPASEVVLCTLHRAAPALIAAAQHLLDEVVEAGVSDGTFDESETGDECCAICGHPTWMECIEDEPCGQMRAAIDEATS